MRIMPHDLAVLAGAGLGLVGIDHEIARPAVGGFLRHERPFQAGRETRPAAAAQARGLHLVDDPVAALVDDRLGAVPCAAAARALEAPVMEAVEVLEDAVLVIEHDVKLPKISGWTANRRDRRRIRRARAPITGMIQARRAAHSAAAGK